METFLKRGFSFTILQASWKLLKAIEILHTSLIGFAETGTPPSIISLNFYQLMWLLLPQFFFNNLYEASSVVRSNLKFSDLVRFLYYSDTKLILYQFGSFGSFFKKFPARFEYNILKLLKLFKTDLVSCCTIWFSSRAVIIHPPDLLGRPSDLRAFHKF